MQAERRRRKPRQSSEWYGVPEGLEIYDTQTSAGWGVRATRDWRFRPEGNDLGNFVGYYRGEILTGRELEQRHGTSDPQYAIRLEEEDWYIDAERAGQGTWARFINDPGVVGGGNVVFVANVSRKEVWVVLAKNVRKGEQVLAEYDPKSVGEDGGGFRFERGGPVLRLGAP